MSGGFKNEAEILSKLGIAQLNPMQEAAHAAIGAHAEVVLLSPTGTGKTLAFLLPVIAGLDPDCAEVQVLILVPSRELALQIEQVIREMGTGYKTNAVYGGRSGSRDKIALQHRPAILVGTPGRVADHFRRETFPTDHIQTLVLDEFDKSLEIGFETEMREIVADLPRLKQKILTSATHEIRIPPFIGLQDPYYLDFLETEASQLQLKRVLSPEKDKLETLVDLLCHLGNQPGIVFCNFKDSIQRVSDYLNEAGIGHGCFHGDLEQADRERTLLKFRNGTHQLIVATDLAARGLDIPEIRFIIHYHLPNRGHEFIHRNGRTARMNEGGTAYVLQWNGEVLPDYVGDATLEKIQKAPLPEPSPWKTVFVSGGRKDKISKGDLAGLFIQQGKLQKEQLGLIEIQQNCAFIAVAATEVEALISRVNNTKLKKKKVRVSLG